MNNIKTITSAILVTMMFGLTACGGNSDSSSVEKKVTFDNGSEWLCQTDAAFKACSDDITCSKQADCKQTVKPKVKTIVKPDVTKNEATTSISSDACQPVNGKVLLAEGESCTFSSAGLNGGATQRATCVGGRISAGFINSRSLTLNGVSIACK